MTAIIPIQFLNKFSKPRIKSSIFTTVYFSKTPCSEDQGRVGHTLLHIYEPRVILLDTLLLTTMPYSTEGY